MATDRHKNLLILRLLSSLYLYFNTLPYLSCMDKIQDTYFRLYHNLDQPLNV